MFYNVTYHHMLHFGSSKHSSNLWGFWLIFKKNNKTIQLSDILVSVGFLYNFTFQSFSCIALCNSVAGRAAKKKQTTLRHAVVVGLISFISCRFEFQNLHADNFVVPYLDHSSFLGHGCGYSASAEPMHVGGAYPDCDSSDI